MPKPKAYEKKMAPKPSPSLGGMGRKAMIKKAREMSKGKGKGK